jgi:hypothetical protein
MCDTREKCVAHLLIRTAFMQPIEVEVISPLPEGWGICLSCEMLMARANMGQAPYERGFEEYPTEWMEEFQRLSTLIIDLSARYGEHILIRIFDPRSLQGLVKSVRYGVRRYPTFIVNKRKKVVGLDAAGLERVLQGEGL